MKFFSRNKARYISYVKAAGVVALFLLIVIPFSKKIFAGEAETAHVQESYMVVLNGTELGYVSDKAVAEEALLGARNDINNDNDGFAFVSSELSFREETVEVELLKEADMQSSMYNVLSDAVQVVDDSTTAYTVRIDDFTLVLESKDDVVELLERVKDKYSNNSEQFSIELVEDKSGVYTSYKTRFVSADVTINEAAMVLSSANSEDKAGEVEADEIVYADGVLSVDFCENIEIIPTKVSVDNIVSVDDAYELITKEHDERGTYTIVYGDCLSSIATKHGLTLQQLLDLNEGFTVNTAIFAGDVVTVTVPASELSVVVIEEQSYDEEYSAPVTYVDNNSWYRGTEKVKSEGSKGSRSVVALVTYVNGKETKREIIYQVVTKEATPKVVERGTLTPPTFIKPVNCSIITNGYKASHLAIDWGVRLGTPVKASCAGTVIMAGWFGNCGYTVKIQHPNGMVTQYSHLSSISVSYGQYVNQGQVIAYSGASGRVTGPHLHFAMYKNGVAVNPLSYVK